jgi:hypothetical protein
MNSYLHHAGNVLLVLVVVLVIGGRFIKGKSRQTAEGLAFPMKQYLFALYLIVLGFVVVMVVSMHGTRLAWAEYLLFTVLVLLLAFRLPGTIVLQPDAVTQHFWLRKDKVIRYPEVMAIQSIQGGRMTKVSGDNRVTILHTMNHAAGEEFRAELSKRTGKQIV